MTSQLCGALTNIILDPIMIFGLLGYPAMGVTGAAVATVIGQCIAAVVAFTCNHKFNTEIKIRFQGFRPDIKIIGTIYAIGVPSIIMQSIGSVMTYSMNRILIAFLIHSNRCVRCIFQASEFLLHAGVRSEQWYHADHRLQLRGSEQKTYDQNDQTPA